jgi:hypothetical protein
MGGKDGTSEFRSWAPADMLSEKPKTGDIVDHVCRDIEWVRGQLS